MMKFNTWWKEKMRQLPKRTKIYGGGHFWDLQDEEGREAIYEWSQERRLNLSTKATLYYRGFLVYTFTLSTLKSFFQNFNYMVLVQMVIAAVSVYLSKYYNLTFSVNVGLFVSPIVFPLAFSINTDFQRREKVLDDLANFKSAGLSWFFCMRDWREAAHLDILWMQAVHQKLKSMLFYMREYLLTNKTSHRKVILRAMYEDFSDTNQLIENLRVSDLPANSALVSRSLVLLTSLCLAFERLRVIREYRSPRSIRSFNKVLIFVLPIVLSPYFVYEGQRSKNNWSPYYISVLVAFVFSALQGVQDKLDDPFDGMSEDDINLSTIDDWTFESLDATANRTFTIGRFRVQTQVSTGGSKEVIFPRSSFSSSIDHIDKSTALSRKFSTRYVSFSGEQKQHKNSSFERPSFRQSVSRKSTMRKLSERSESLIDSFNLESHPYANILDKIQGNTKIFPGGVTRPVDDTYRHSLNSIGEDSETNEDQNPLPISDDSTNTPGTSCKESHSVSTDAFESPTTPSKLRLYQPKKPKFGFKMRKVSRGSSKERIRFLKPEKESTHSENFVVIDTMKDSKSNSDHNNSDLDDSVFDDISM